MLNKTNPEALYLIMVYGRHFYNIYISTVKKSFKEKNS